MPNGHIIIGAYQFNVSMPYSPGDTITADEADALNRYRAELIQRSCSRWVQRSVDEANRVLSLETLNTLQDRIAQFDAEFKVSGRKPPAQSFYDRELTAVAQHYLMSNSLPLDQIDEVKKLPEVHDLTRRVIEARFESLLENEDT